MPTAPKLRQLEHLVLLADELHFARAAERACLSQSAFSRSVQTLESTLGLRLVDRGPRAVRLTAVGERVAARARRLLSSSIDLSREVSLLRSGDLGDVAVGAGPFSGSTLVASALAELSRNHPGVRVRLDISNWSTLLQHLQEEKLDFFVAEIRELLPSDELLIEPLGSLTGALFCRAGHPLTKLPSVTLSDLRMAQFASVQMPAQLRRRLAVEVATDAHAEFPIAFECDSVAVLREIVLQSDLILVAVDHAVRHDVAAGLIKRLAVRELELLGQQTPLATELGLVRLKSRTPAPASDLLMAQVRVEAERLLIYPKQRAAKAKRTGDSRTRTMSRAEVAP